MVKVITGDVLDEQYYPHKTGNKLLIHLCNSDGFWAKGFVVALSKKFPQPEAEYRKLVTPALGTVQFVQVQNDIYVGNIIGQQGIRSIRDGSPKGCPPIRYDAIYACLEEVSKFAKQNNCVVYCPKFGAGLASGNWNVVSALLEVVLKDLDVTVFDLDSLNASKTMQPASAVQQAVLDSVHKANGKTY
jgi:hypothetical protein